MTPEPVGLYVHIPFCRSKCAYCDFVSYPGMTDVWPHYLEALVSEIAAMAPLRPRTLYIGGGTPTAWPVEYLEAVIAAARLAGLPETAEVTVEANPGTVSAEALQRLWHAGCNRLSIGVQSTFERSLRLLGRIHSFEDARAAVRWARRAGFGNVSIDLIYGLPGQSESEWLADLERAVALGVEHLSRVRADAGSGHANGASDCQRSTAGARPRRRRRHVRSGRGRARGPRLRSV